MPTEPWPPPVCDLRVDADHAAVGVEQRAARVAGVDRGVGLDHVGDREAVGRLDLALRAPDTMPVVTVRLKPNGLPIATTGSPTCALEESPSGIGREVLDLRRVDLQHREVGGAVDALDLGRRSARRSRRSSPCTSVRALDHVRVGDDVAVLVEHEARAGRRCPAAGSRTASRVARHARRPVMKATPVPSCL